MFPDARWTTNHNPQARAKPVMAMTWLMNTP